MRQKNVNWFKVRIFLVCCVLCLCFAMVLARMFQLQVLKKERLYEMAAKQQRIQIPLAPKRGAILDRKGNELAVSVEVDSVHANPKQVTDPEKTASAIAGVLQIDKEDIQRRLKSGRSFEWVERKISSKEAEQIKALKLPGIYFVKENQRFYPNGALAAHVVGFVGIDSRGLEGVEVQYDGQLNGNNIVWTMSRDAMGREIATGEAPFVKEEHFSNVHLTLDKQIQYVAETELARAVQKWNAKGGFLIAMEPSTGKILAMACYPAFNPNQYLQGRAKVWRNRAVADAFEPGSMFKTFAIAAALEEKIVSPADSFFCENGSYKVGRETIHDHGRHGWLTVQQIIKFSSNIGASKIAEKMGKERFYRFISGFGFGEKTKVGLPGEARGIVHAPGSWSPVALDTISFGQGISVTGIQLLSALSAIANGGTLMKPYLVEKITNEKGEVVQAFKPEPVRRIVSEDSALKVTAMLKTVTEKGGTAEAAALAGYEVAGKTGTAQKVDGLLGRYAEDRYTSGFMGFGPADDPRIAMVVVIDEPRGNDFGGVVSAPVFRTVSEKVFPYLNALPRGTMVVKREPAEADPKPETRETEKPIEEVRVGRTVGKETMPDLTGLSMRNALSRIEGKGLIVKVSGSGKVIEQTPRAGVPIERGDICFLKFQSPS
jgi:cell division protein FtsI (penicillin-binding protein 3)